MISFPCVKMQANKMKSFLVFVPMLGAKLSQTSFSSASTQEWKYSVGKELWLWCSSYHCSHFMEVPQWSHNLSNLPGKVDRECRLLLVAARCQVCQPNCPTFSVLLLASAEHYVITRENVRQQTLKIFNLEWSIENTWLIHMSCLVLLN